MLNALGVGSRSSQGNGLKISIIAETGTPVLYVTNDGSLPGPTNYEWHSNAVGTDVLLIDEACRGR